MIGDTLRQKVQGPGLRALLELAEWVKCPFPVYPYIQAEGCLDWHVDRIPKPLVPTDPDGRLQIDRFPFSTIGIFGEGEPGAVLAVEMRGDSDAAVHEIMRRLLSLDPQDRYFSTMEDVIDGFVQAYLLGENPTRTDVGISVFRYIIRREEKVPRTDQYAPRFLQPLLLPLYEKVLPEDFVRTMVHLALQENLEVTLRGAGKPVSAIGPASLDQMVALMGGMSQVLDDLRLDTAQVAITLATTMALMNAKNLATEIVEPTPQSRASRRRGEPPPYRYHVLKIDPQAARSKGRGTAGGSHVALHLTRGHWKLFGPDRPLLGKHVGRWWWASHLAGKADRVVEKEYEISPPEEQP